MFYTFTSESVSDGHPDKIADQISDAVLDAVLAKDPKGRCACEVLIKNNLVIVAGEISTSTYIDIDALVHDVCNSIGYTDHRWGFDAKSATVLKLIDQQSGEIAHCVDQDETTIGAGDQGMMFGYACTDTDSLMPLAITLSHQLMAQHKKVRSTDHRLGPDAKAQVTVNYDGHKPVGVDTIVISSMHDESISQADLKTILVEQVIRPVVPEKWLTKTKLVINPSGKFTQGGPIADAGLTGRKIIVDTYGGFAHHGGGAFSGKDPSKVDRSAAYMARYIAKNLVASGIAPQIELQLSYAIGQVEPVSIAINTFGSVDTPTAKIEALVKSIFDCRPAAIIKQLDLTKPIYRQTASFGHFGRDDLQLPWERLDKVEEIQEKAATMAIQFHDRIIG